MDAETHLDPIALSDPGSLQRRAFCYGQGFYEIAFTITEPVSLTYLASLTVKEVRLPDFESRLVYGEDLIPYRYVPSASIKLSSTEGLSAIGLDLTNTDSASSTIVLPAGKWKLRSDFMAFGSERLSSNVGVELDFRFEKLMTPVITRSPSSKNIAIGLPVVLEASASGVGVSFQWFKNNVAIVGATTPNLTIPKFSVADIGAYVLEAINASGKTVTASAILSELKSPEIVVTSDSRLVVAGSPVLLSVDAFGEELSYQWFHNDQPISEATNRTLTLPAFSTADTGGYRVRVTNAAGQISSRLITLELKNYLRNLSARGQASPSLPLTVGFVIRGSRPQTVLLRGIGPQLTDFGVKTAATDTVLRLYDSNSRLLAENDNWDGSDPTKGVAAAARVAGAFPLSDRGLDAALLIELPPGGYTAQVSSVNTAGVVLVEIYDLTGSDEDVRFVNLSTLAWIGDGDAVLITGFTLTGPDPRMLLVRAVGPTLAQFGVPNYLPDPSIEIFSGTKVMAQNNNWSSSTDAAATALSASQAGAFALPFSSLDAASVISLTSGSYTVVVTDTNKRQGQILVEIYDLGK